MTENMRKLLIVGGRGALGMALVQHFKSRNTWVASIDHSENSYAHLSIIIDSAANSTSEEKADWIVGRLKEDLKIEEENSLKFLDGIICVAGGWAGGNVSSDGFLGSVDLMWKQSVESSAIAAHLAGRLLKEGGLLVMTGAHAALAPTPTMIGYGMAKAAVHHLIKSLASEGSGLPKNAKVVGLLPRTLDTPNNRKFAAAHEEFGSWTPLDHVSGLIEKWMNPTENEEVKNGSLLAVLTKNGETYVEMY